MASHLLPSQLSRQTGTYRLKVCVLPVSLGSSHCCPSNGPR